MAKCNCTECDCEMRLTIHARKEGGPSYVFGQWSACYGRLPPDLADCLENVCFPEFLVNVDDLCKSAGKRPADDLVFCSHAELVCSDGTRLAKDWSDQCFCEAHAVMTAGISLLQGLNDWPHDGKVEAAMKAQGIRSGPLPKDVAARVKKPSYSPP